MNLFEKLPLQDFDLGAPSSHVLVFVSKVGQHVGYIYVRDDKKMESEPSKYRGRTFHLGSEIHTEDIDPGKSQRIYLAATLGLHPDTALAFAGYLKAFDDNKPRVRFGIDWANARGSFGHDKSFREGSNHTCATLVVDLLEGFGLPSVDFDTWPKDVDEDRKWAEGRLDYYEGQLAKLGAEAPLDQAGIDAMRKVSPVMRLKPTEAAAALASAQPALMQHEAATQLAAQVLASFVKAFS
ncbi:MAG TPA: hypothetical protein PLN33_18100 [Hyphomonadaceae bacterium]|nr:hypothetical protein [Hyphomonadaceae bacterium]